jgi:hypothetical protein
VSTQYPLLPPSPGAASPACVRTTLTTTP